MTMTWTHLTWRRRERKTERESTGSATMVPVMKSALTEMRGKTVAKSPGGMAAAITRSLEKYVSTSILSLEMFHSHNVFLSLKHSMDTTVTLTMRPGTRDIKRIGGTALMKNLKMGRWEKMGRFGREVREVFFLNHHPMAAFFIIEYAIIHASIFYLISLSLSFSLIQTVNPSPFADPSRKCQYLFQASIL